MPPQGLYAQKNTSIKAIKMFLSSEDLQKNSEHGIPSEGLLSLDDLQKDIPVYKPSRLSFKHKRPKNTSEHGRHSE